MILNRIVLNMQQKTLYFFGFSLFMWNLFVISNSKALIGENVRHALDEEFPYIVTISYKSKNVRLRYEHLCTGSLVTHRDVLTVEHVFRTLKKEKVRVGVGSANLSNAVYIPIRWWLTHDQWIEEYNFSKPYRRNDIAMTRLRTNVSSNIEPIHITDLRTRFLIGRDVIIAGWGKKEDGKISRILQTGILTVQDLDECRYKIKTLQRGKPYTVENSFLCTYTKPHLLVQKGDSGSPILYHNKVVGVTVAGCPFPEIPQHPEKVNLHISTYEFRAFISHVVEHSCNALSGDNVRHALDEEFPYIVSLTYQHPTKPNLYKHFCTGSLVSNRDILTAAHCIKKKKLAKVRVAIGSANLGDSEHLKLLAWITFKQWGTQHNVTMSFKYNDVAMIRLIGNVTDRIQPLPLSELRSKDFVGRQVIIAGWGRNTNDVPPMILQTSSVDVIDLEECRYKVKETEKFSYIVERVFFCTVSNPHVEIDSGDGGAPIMYHSEMVGLAVIIGKPGKHLKPKTLNIHASIYNYRGFIFDVILNC